MALGAQAAQQTSISQCAAGTDGSASKQHDVTVVYPRVCIAINSTSLPTSLDRGCLLCPTNLFIWCLSRNVCSHLRIAYSTHWPTSHGSSRRPYHISRSFSFLSFLFYEVAHLHATICLFIFFVFSLVMGHFAECVVCVFYVGGRGSRARNDTFSYFVCHSLFVLCFVLRAYVLLFYGRAWCTGWRPCW